MLRLRRITSSGRFIPEIDGLRFAAIASVVLYHLHGFVVTDGIVAQTHDSFRAAVEHGYRGVNLFYVISGFILGLPFAAHHLNAQPPVSLRSYFLRRVTRLEPPYILNLLISFALLVTLQGASAGALLPHLGASLFYLHNLWFGEPSALSAVAWTLEVEVQFYCLVPLLALIFLVRSTLARRSALVAIILFAGFAQKLCWQEPLRFKLTVLYAIQFFLAGFLLADIYLVEWKGRATSHWGWDLLAFFCWPILFVAGDYEVWAYLPLLILAVFVAAFKGVVFNRLFTHKIITSIGGMCYTIYLFHYQLIRPVLHLTKSIRIGHGFDAYFALQLLFYAPILLLASGLYFVLVERPCMAHDWPQRLFQRLAGRPALPLRITSSDAQFATTARSKAAMPPG
jgi:peptidoglycan/LPS O-acetylase OafA/YrhL